MTSREYERPLILFGPEELEPISYHNVPDQELRGKLEEFESEIKKVKNWGVSSIKNEFCENFGFLDYKLADFITSLRMSSVFSFPGDRYHNNNRYYFTPNILRSLKAISFVKRRLELARSFYDEKIVLKTIISKTKEALGENMLSGIIQEPKKHSEYKSPILVRDEPHNIVVSARTTVHNQETRKEEVADTSRDPRQLLKSKIPEIDDIQIREALSWRKKELEDLQLRLPNDYERVSARDNIPPGFDQMIMFISIAHNGLKSFDPYLRGLTRLELRGAIPICLQYMEENPKITNLGHLFYAVRQATIKKIDSTPDQY